jgi:two-component system cell cycle sensor histidine kinase/response regulator CckA
MKDFIRVLLVDDSEDDAGLVVRSLKSLGRDVVAHRVDDAASMQGALESDAWDVVICDWSMPRFSGLAAHALLKKVRGDLPFIISSGTCTEEMAIEAMQSGARDWVPKDSLGRLAPAVRRELEKEAERKRHEEALRRSEDQLRHAQKMDALGGLAAGVAHDFNNLLSVILGHAELVLSDPEVTGANHESLDEIRAAGVRAADLTRQLLAFSRQQVLQPRIVELDELVAGLEKMLRRLVGEDIDLRTRRASGARGRILADPGQIEQVIMNLVVNARDAMPRGGALTIETDVLDLRELDAGAQARAGELRELPAGPYVVLTVTDTGTGMDEATRARIFEPFFTTKDPGRGTGLGLAMVFGIVKQSRGVIATRSELGRGTSFAIYFPVAGATGPSTSRLDANHGPDNDKNVPSDDAPRGSETILLVEDDEAVRGLVRTILERQGYNVLPASNGDEALALARQLDGARIDLLLTDVIMPRLNGRELSERLVAVRPGCKTLFMSGYTAGAIMDRGGLEPGSTFLQKPVTPETLLRMVREALGSAGVAGPSA